MALPVNSAVRYGSSWNICFWVAHNMHKREKKRSHFISSTQNEVQDQLVLRKVIWNFVGGTLGNSTLLNQNQPFSLYFFSDQLKLGVCIQKSQNDSILYLLTM